MNYNGSFSMPPDQFTRLPEQQVLPEEPTASHSGAYEAPGVINHGKPPQESAPFEPIDSLYRLSHRLTTAVTAEEIVQILLTTIAETDADGWVIARFDFAQETGDEADAITPLGAWCRDAVAQLPIGRPFQAPGNYLPLTTFSVSRITEDMTQAPGFPAKGYEFLLPLKNGAAISIPLRIEARTMGIMIVQRARPGPLSSATARFYEIVADQAAVALDRARLYEEVQRRIAEEEVLSRITAQMHETLDLDLVLQTAIREIATAFHIPKVEVRMATGANRPENRHSQAEPGGEHAEPD